MRDLAARDRHHVLVACLSAARSRRSPCPSQPNTTCRSRPWSLAKLANFLVAEGVVDDISHEGLRILLRERKASPFNA